MDSIKLTPLYDERRNIMGMFDTVKYKAKCWRCGFEINDFQSKDGDCSLSTISVKKVSRFYGSCNKCHAWNEYDVIPKDVEIIFNEKESKLNTHESPTSKELSTNK